MRIRHEPGGRVVYHRLLTPQMPTICMCKVAIGVFAPSASGMVDFEAAKKAQLLAHDDLPSSGVCVTRVRLSFECSRLRWRQVLVDRSAAANDTRGFASCRRPIRFPDRQREPEISMPEVTERDVDAFRPTIRRARFRPTARDRLDRGGIAGISVSVAKLEVGGNPKDTAVRLRQA